MLGKQHALDQCYSKEELKKMWANGGGDRASHLLDKHTRYSARHINYHTSMVAKGLSGILDVDKKVDITSDSDPVEKVGEMSLRGVLYNLKLQDGHTLFGEIY